MSYPAHAAPITAMPSNPRLQAVAGASPWHVAPVAPVAQVVHVAPPGTCLGDLGAHGGGCLETQSKSTCHGGLHTHLFLGMASDEMDDDQSPILEDFGKF